MAHWTLWMRQIEGNVRIVQSVLVRPCDLTILQARLMTDTVTVHLLSGGTDLPIDRVTMNVTKRDITLTQ